ncbi:putative succinyl-CoA:3-ketoacid coenzyme A subunit A [Streptomyces scabiei]|uniref:Putative succinyl-CoA:3-ketoacid coenzyme A subunit A n=1 Tax=Streptomyces scabiei TaxID=1930 RepID=A0A100JT69_STRSC|nr:putative succinyl-CoA:3-ketoacid coenzyme A subunit A [Streptomyces scabiei]
MPPPQLVNNSNAASLVTASGNGEYLLPLLVNKTARTLRGRAYVLEEAITTDFALVRASPGDRHGNLAFHRSAADFTPVAAMAGRTTIAQVEELVELGAIDPGAVHLPGIYVDRVVDPVPAGDKDVEKRTVRTREERH